MRKLVTLLAIPALCAAGLAAWAVQEDAKKDQDRAKVEREIRELEEQRAKIDSRLRELRRQSGRSAGRPRIYVGEDLQKLSPEDREKVEKALETAHKAVEEATKNLPDFDVMIPDVHALTERILKLHGGKDGKLFLHDGELTPEQREKLAKEMARMREELKKIGPEIRARFQRDGAFKERMKGLEKLKELKSLKELKGDGELKGRDNADVRAALEEARREMEQAREEMRKAREEMLRELREERSRREREPEKKPETDRTDNIDPV